MTNHPLLRKRTDHYASYKDPAAKVFFKEDEPEYIFREISPSYFIHYNHFQSSGLAAELIKKKWLISFEKISGERLILKARKIPFISFPYEWTFSQWKEAAMLTMKIQFQALKFGMILKDATPFNVVFNGSTPIFIDLSSFEIYSEGKPWEAYKQFSENFYLPLLIYKYFDATANDIYMNNSNGIPLSKGLQLLPLKAHLNLSTFFYLSLPDKIRKQTTGSTVSPSKTSARFSHKKMLQFSEQLFTNIKRLKQSKKATKWNNYYEKGTEAKYVVEKQDIIKKWFGNEYHDKTLIDFGCNTGNFSKLLSPKVKTIIAFDEDCRSVDELNLYCRENGIDNVFCFTANISSPTPSTGWQNMERPALKERLKGDVALALALTHHLAIGAYINFNMQAAMFAGITKELFIEFVPREDHRVELLLAGRHEIFSWYNQFEFMKAFEVYFDLVKKHNFHNNRMLVHFIKKNDGE